MLKFGLGYSSPLKLLKIEVTCVSTFNFKYVYPKYMDQYEIFPFYTLVR